ncbi:phage tail sheath subtilisin-like domain-containing protein [Kribbella sancticallisti]|uniref:Phage tail sheath subtilisin-like domain-containing protein n=1 Tax=Kribbella sancticallisti TaxID=460087 RepID=A0ABP4MZ70_9ACTN
MVTLLHPGVYVTEIPAGLRSIEGAPTSTTIFVGETERGPLGPTKITSRADYERLFGGYYRAREASPPAEPTRVLTTYAMDAFYANGGSTAYVLRAMDGADAGLPARRESVVASSPGVWGESVAVAFLAPSGVDASRFRIVVVYDSPDPGKERRVVETWDRLSVVPGDENYVVDILQRSGFIRWDDSTPVTAPTLDLLGSPPSTAPSESDIVLGATALSGGVGGGEDLGFAQYSALLAEQLEGVDDAALLVATCDALLSQSADYTSYVSAFVAYAEGRPRRDLFFVGDLPRQRTAATASIATSATLLAFDSLGASNFSAMYWPHVVVGDVAGVGRNPTITLPPAPFVAGVFARIDGRRGVWKAPAGTEATLALTVGLEHQLNDLHSDELNPVGVNALRTIPGAGRAVWGSRTMMPSSEWRYVPVRRTAIFLRTSIYNGIQWAVFEPNDEPLWSSLRASIGAFMETQFRRGAFAGRTSDEAYQVKVDSETTTPIDQAAGVVNILVGFAPLRPAEFVVVQLSQKTQATA